MIKVMSLISIFLIHQVLFAQNEGNIWYFGNKAGIDFNSGKALALTNSEMHADEGCATISDNLGNLLFYTEGTAIWNANHTIMPNGSGLLGNSSNSFSTQAVIIVKKPLSNTIYYVFTVDDIAGPNGLNYSEVDISLQGGLGDVNLNKNISVVTPVSEKITAVKHQNGVDFWIIVQIHNTNTLQAYLLSSTGLNTSPVSSNVGSIVSGAGHTGHLKASPDGSRLAMASYGLSLFDFDNLTGNITNSISWPNFNAFYYGVEFSPNGNILYASTESSLDQYDLQVNSLSSILASKINLANITIGFPPSRFGALQLAPDGKIYNAISFSSGLGVINNPNILGIGCNYTNNGFTLGASTTSILGLPNFFSSIFNSPKPSGFNCINLCFGDLTSFNISASDPIDSVLWDFGDPNSGLLNTSTETTPTHQFSATGSFNVSLINYLNGFADTTIKKLTINHIPTINLGRDTTLCQGETLTLDATTSNATYLWQDSSTNPALNVTEQRNYWAEVTVSNCSKTDTILINYNPSPSIKLGNDTNLCQGQTLTLDATTSNATYIWQDNSTNSNFNVTERGTYWIQITNNCGTVSDTVIIQIEDDCDIILEMPTILTPNGDGINDLFVPVISKGIISLHTTILSRWGNKIFETNNLLVEWAGQDVSDGTYFWIVNYTDINGVENSLKGHVTVLK